MIGPSWHERAEREIEEEYESGHMSLSEFQSAMRDLNAELRDAAEQAVEDARDAYLGGW